MASQLLHDLIDAAENAWREVMGIKATADAKMADAIKALRAHAEADGGQILADAKTAGEHLVTDVKTEAAPVVADVEHAAADLTQTAEAQFSGGSAAGDQTAAEPTPETAA